MFVVNSKKMNPDVATESNSQNLNSRTSKRFQTINSDISSKPFTNNHESDNNKPQSLLKTSENFQIIKFSKSLTCQLQINSAKDNKINHKQTFPNKSNFSQTNNGLTHKGPKISHIHKKNEGLRNFL